MRAQLGLGENVTVCSRCGTCGRGGDGGSSSLSAVAEEVVDMVADEVLRALEEMGVQW
jgi:hypothetical protein